MEHVQLRNLEHMLSKGRLGQQELDLDHEVSVARQRATRYILNSRLDERRSADGRLVGVQSRIALGPRGKDGLDLTVILDGLLTSPEQAEHVFAQDPLRVLWQKVAEEIQNRLGFPLEPELFSNMLLVAFLGKTQDAGLSALNRTLLSSFAHSDVRGLYHFFTSLRFACDVDCTGMAARARLLTGDIDPKSELGKKELRQITQRILGSAAVVDVSSQHNESHGKQNGVLRRLVFKVYLDDHELQGAALDRGLKNNPVVVINGLLPVLAEISWGLRSLDEVIPLKEYPAPDAAARTGEATVREIIAANLSYVMGYFLSGEFRSGCRYYESPDAFLCFFSDLLVHFPAIHELFDVREALCTAIEERREVKPNGEVDDPEAPLNLALRAIAASNTGIDPSHEWALLVAAQDPDGGFSRYSPLFALGTKHGHNLYFGSKEQT
ncbi:MAG TPA: hypothetical protein VN764_04775, partial [Polyangiaceae bacterium]|nr:hypothetical protein [Polyangiaceae bacterium]